MKKSVIVRRIILAVLFAAVLLVTPAIFIVKTPRAKNTSKWTSTIEVKDGKVNPSANSIGFTIKETGEQTLYFSLLPEGYDKDNVGNVRVSDIGFVTTLIVTDSHDNVVYSSTQGAVYLDTVIFLQAGDYKVTYYYFSDEDEFYDFASTYVCGSKEAAKMAKDLNFDAFKDNVSTVFNYEFSFLSSEEGLVFPSIMLAWGIVVGLLGSVLIAEFFFFGKTGERKYDERQLLEQGKGFKIGFFTMFVIVEALIILNISGIATVLDYPVFYQTAVLLGLIAYVVYCIWNESYFAINEKSTSVIVLFAIIALINLVIGVINIIHGQIIVNGRITFKILNLICVFVFVAFFATMLIKRIVKSKSESSDDDEEEEDE